MREAGQLKDGIYLVLAESKGEEGIGWTHSCGEDIMAARITPPIWDGPFPCSGSGRVRSEIIPYCPKCEEKPDSSGTPISER